MKYGNSCNGSESFDRGWGGSRHAGSLIGMGRFCYLRDALFLLCCTAYGVNQLLLKPHFHLAFLHNHFNDCLIIPCALPPLLLAHRLLKLRGSDAPPSASEVALHVVVWSIVIEWVGPHYVHWAVGDPWDAVSYAAGGLVAWLWWNRERWKTGRLLRMEPHEL